MTGRSHPHTQPHIPPPPDEAAHVRPLEWSDKMDPNEMALIQQLSRQGGGNFIGSDGQQVYVSGPNQIEMLHRVCELLLEIRDLLKALSP